MIHALQKQIELEAELKRTIDGIELAKKEIKRLDKHRLYLRRELHELKDGRQRKLFDNKPAQIAQDH